MRCYKELPKSINLLHGLQKCQRTTHFLRYEVVVVLHLTFALENTLSSTSFSTGGHRKQISWFQSIAKLSASPAFPFTISNTIRDYINLRLRLLRHELVFFLIRIELILTVRGV